MAPQLEDPLTVFLLPRYTQERRSIGYWFKSEYPTGQRACAAQEFFKELVSPVDFPRGEDKEPISFDSGASSDSYKRDDKSSN